MGGGDFFARIEELRENVGEKVLKGRLKVDQHYALEQHENMNYEHPRGGGPHYLRNPLLEHAPQYLAAIIVALNAKGALSLAMAANMEHLSTLLDPAAPIDEDPNYIRLRRSGNPIVYDDEREVYNRAPLDSREPMTADDENRHRDGDHDFF